MKTGVKMCTFYGGKRISTYAVQIFSFFCHFTNSDAPRGGQPICKNHSTAIQIQKYSGFSYSYERYEN